MKSVPGAGSDRVSIHRTVEFETNNPVATAPGTDWVLCRDSLTSPSETLTVLARENKRLNHIGVRKVAVELVQLRQPEVITRVV